ncbi:MAG: biotin--[acetyl-CoA-carboxylase] ligase [Anaerolineae bacterium]|nr:biotin--[acetyl-CoA-carboxylase] ligase [Anaerolineae bacterium]
MAVASRLRTRVMGRPLVYAPRLSSTQNLAAYLAARGWPEGTVVLAEEQTAGRGRQGRSWWAPYGGALLLSLLLRPSLSPSQAQQLTMVAGLAAAEAIEAVCAVPVALKWPNDLYARGRKVGGILVESRLSPDGRALDHAIVGIGINVTVEFADQPELRAIATSLHVEANRPVERETLLLALLERTEARYEALLAGQPCHVEWASRLLWLGEAVLVVTPDGSLAGVAIGVSEEGALLVRRIDGEVEAVWTGDVRRWTTDHE